jgi:hypothetical protein
MPFKGWVLFDKDDKISYINTKHYLENNIL